MGQTWDNCGTYTELVWDSHGITMGQTQDYCGTVMG